MNIERATVANSIPVLRLHGELDLRNVPEVRREMRALLEEGQVNFIINLTDLEFIDSSGLGVLVGGLARVRERQGDMKLACGNRRILRVFEMTRLNQLFDIYESEEEAAKNLPTPQQAPGEQAA